MVSKVKQVEQVNKLSFTKVIKVEQSKHNEVR